MILLTVTIVRKYQIINLVMAVKICTYDIVCMFPLGEVRTSKYA